MTLEPGASAPSDVNSAPARPLRAGRAGTGAAAGGRARGWRCSAAWWARLSSDSRRAGPRAAIAPWRRSTAAPSAWKSTTGPWPSAAAATRECAGLREAAGSGAAAGRSEATPAQSQRARTWGARGFMRSAVAALWARPSASAQRPARPPRALDPNHPVGRQGRPAEVPGLGCQEPLTASAGLPGNSKGSGRDICAGCLPSGLVETGVGNCK